MTTELLRPGYSNISCADYFSNVFNIFVREKGKLYLNTKGSFRTFQAVNTVVKEILVNGPWKLEFMVPQRSLLLSWLNT